MSELTQAIDTIIEKAQRAGSHPMRFFDTPYISSSVIISEQCFYCSKWVPPSDLRTIGVAVKMCVECQHKHIKNMLEFEPPPFCQMCMKTVQALAALGDDRMAVHYKDDIYQAVCMSCDAIYVQQRKDLYARTPFGYNERKL